jgi:hypothetical protein
MTMRGTARRLNDREQQRLAANHRVGHEQAYFLLFVWPVVKTLAPVAAVAFGLWWLWMNVDRTRIVTVVAVSGIVCLVTYGARLVAFGSRRRRSFERLHTGWHIVLLVGVLLLAAAFLAAGVA